MFNIMEKGYEFDDVLVMPTKEESGLSSRDEVDISVDLLYGFKLRFPLIASPMVGVVDAKFAHSLSKLGGVAILHRFYPSLDSLKRDVSMNLEIGDDFGLSVKVGSEDFKELLELEPRILLVDTANGYSPKLQEYCNMVKTYIVKQNIPVMLMAGNVVTLRGCSTLWNNGCDLIRVGIGGGSPCSTRNQTGIGIPNITALVDCRPDGDTYKMVIDGGIKNSGDFVKAIVAGAHLGMAGRLYAECYESPNEGVLYGMASRTHMENTNAEIKSVEGFDIQIEKKQSLAQFVREFGYGIKSAGTYLNATTLVDMYSKGEFISVSNSAIKKGV